MICNTCNGDKDEKEFHWRFKEKGIRLGKCKQCANSYNQKYYQKNRQYLIQKNKEYYKKVSKNNSVFIYEIKLSNPCELCGESDPRVLQFDHQDPKKKKRNISEMKNRYGHRSILREMCKCMVLCANCHQKKTAKQYLWYDNIFGDNDGNT